MEAEELSAATDFSALKYAELQKHAKKVGIKANIGHKKLVAALIKYHSEEESQKGSELSQIEKTDNAHQEPSGRVTKTEGCGTPKEKTGKRTPSRTPVRTSRSLAEKHTTIHSPDVQHKEENQTSVKNSRQQTGKHTPIHSPAVNSKEQKLKQTPLHSPAVRAPKQMGKQTPVRCPAVNSKQQKLKQTPVGSPALKQKRRQTPVPNPDVNTERHTPVVQSPGINKLPTEKSTPVGKKLSGSGKRKASDLSPKSPAASSPPAKRRRSTFEIPQASDSATQDEDVEGGGSPQTNELIGALKPEMTNEEMKNTLMSAIDKKVQAKCQTDSASKTSSSIPRFAAFLAKKREMKPSTPGSGKKPVTPGNKDWAKIHKKNFDKFDSIDVYLDKKKQRAEEITASVKKAKNILAEVQASVNKLKSHKTPTIENLVKKPRRSSDAKKTAPFKPTAINLSEANFNFSAMKSPKTLPMKIPNSMMAASGKKVAATPQPSALNTTSTNFNSTQKCLTTPFRFTATLNTTLNKTQSVKKSAFDLQASLAKPLTWVPHKGKLKPFGEKTSPYKKPAIGQSIGKARDARRADAAQRRANKKNEQKMARRGIQV